MYFVCKTFSHNKFCRQGLRKNIVDFIELCYTCDVSLKQSRSKIYMPL